MGWVTLTFELETSVRVASKVGNLLPNLGTLSLWVLVLYPCHVDHLSVSSRHSRAFNEKKFMSLPVRTDVFEYSFFPRTITDWNFLQLAVRLSQSIQFFHGALLNSASSNRC